MATRWSPRLFRWHRWLGYLVAWQVLAWMVGGVLFAWVPFQAWVKAGDVLATATEPLPSQWPQALARAQLPDTPVLALSSVSTAAGPAWKLRTAQGEHWLDAQGAPLAAPDATAIARYAQQRYRGDGRLQAVERLAEVGPRWGIVRELGERREVWVARFDDTLSTRFYLDARSGELLAARNDAWVLYDFFWRLHVMDYRGGEDFNNPLLRAAALLALGLVAVGVVMLLLALRRHWRRPRG
ncbi:PepSY domain-containing protein [Ideonella alba]|uniref:PepSY domain-containing protein n=1 Tax=Ideonella alba TaxID=2824118 RepID=A0A941BKH3_9BURK|nr:PepSY domain-containing protein [Ideonella alba]MBQ0930124.1 PepSY domain-containing protein [Ideonella alba]